VLHDVARLMRTRFDRYARAYGMTRAQGLILLRLKVQPGLSQNELAAICEVEPMTVARLIDRLEANGYVKRCDDPNDRRIHRLKLLPAAEPILAEIARYKNQIRDDLAQGLDPADWAAAAKVLYHIKDKLTADVAAEEPPAAVGE
ncbi:MAG: MarR family transcriptional regulator, partial [Alphaproteobacteria bacterium]|nr:MarR family transcriptional regulator [Alphaproteobacteria bacterium]